jgi:hypothetical protein
MTSEKDLETAKTCGMLYQYHSKQIGKSAAIMAAMYGSTKNIPKIQLPEGVSLKEYIKSKQLLGLPLTFEEEFRLFYGGDVHIGQYTGTGRFSGKSPSIYIVDEVSSEPAPDKTTKARRPGVQMRVDPRKGYVLPERKK